MLKLGPRSILLFPFRFSTRVSGYGVVNALDVSIDQSSELDAILASILVTVIQVLALSRFVQVIDVRMTITCAVY